MPYWVEENQLSLPWTEFTSIRKIIICITQLSIANTIVNYLREKEKDGDNQDG